MENPGSATVMGICELNMTYILSWVEHTFCILGQLVKKNAPQIFERQFSNRIIEGV